MSGGSCPALAIRSRPVVTSSTPAIAVTNRPADLVDEDQVRPFQSLGGPRRVIEGGLDHRTSEGHQHPRADPLAGDVGDDDSDRPSRRCTWNSSKKSPPISRAAS